MKRKVLSPLSRRQTNTDTSSFTPSTRTSFNNSGEGLQSQRGLLTIPKARIATATQSTPLLSASSSLPVNFQRIVHLEKSREPNSTVGTEARIAKVSSTFRQHFGHLLFRSLNSTNKNNSSDKNHNCRSRATTNIESTSSTCDTTHTLKSILAPTRIIRSVLSQSRHKLASRIEYDKHRLGYEIIGMEMADPNRTRNKIIMPSSERSRIDIGSSSSPSSPSSPLASSSILTSHSNFQTSSTQKKFLKSIRMYAFGMCAFALCTTTFICLFGNDGNKPASEVGRSRGGVFMEGTVRNTRVADEKISSTNNRNSRIPRVKRPSGTVGNDTNHDHDEGMIRKLRKEFHEWMDHHSRDYGNKEEQEKRFHIWKENHFRTMEKNEQHGPCKLTGNAVFGSNHFKDLTHEEFKAKYLTGYAGPKTDELDDRKRRQLRTSNEFREHKHMHTKKEHAHPNKATPTDHLSSDGLHDPNILSDRISRHESVHERYLKHVESTPKLSKTYYNKEDKAKEKACKCGTSYNSDDNYSTSNNKYNNNNYSNNSKNYSNNKYNNNSNRNYSNNNNYSSNSKSNNYSNNNNYSGNSGNNNYNRYYNKNNYGNRKLSGIFKRHSRMFGKTYYNKSEKQMICGSNYGKTYYNSGSSSSSNQVDCSKYKLESDFDYDQVSSKWGSTNTCGWLEMSCWMRKIFNPVFSGSARESKYSNYNYPSSIDWRKIGAITNVHSQGSCGACWAITATETIEAANYIATGNLFDLSETEIIICEDSCLMCDGGWPQNAYDYVEENNGLPAEGSSTYDGNFLMTLTMVTSGESDEMTENEVEYIKETTCPAEDGSNDNGDNSSSSATRYGAIKGYAYATDRCVCYTDGSGCDCDEQNESLAVMNVASYGPATICLEASQWQDYTGGIITADSGCSSAFLDMNHCVQVVGYAYTDVSDDDEEGNDGEEGSGDSHDSGDESGSHKEGYWIVRNQWSSYWGMSGYAYVAMGDNTCGILNDMTQVFMD